MCRRIGNLTSDQNSIKIKPHAGRGNRGDNQKHDEFRARLQVEVAPRCTLQPPPIVPMVQLERQIAGCELESQLPPSSV